MSEQPQNQEPFFRLNITKGEESSEFIAHRDNTSLYRHLGSLGLNQYDHAYIDLTTGEEKICTRIWRHNDSYAQIEQFMVANKFIVHDNLRDVNKYDAEAYDELISREAGLESVPDDWVL